MELILLQIGLLALVAPSALAKSCLASALESNLFRAVEVRLAPQSTLQRPSRSTGELSLKREVDGSLTLSTIQNNIN